MDGIGDALDLAPLSADGKGSFFRANCRRVDQLAVHNLPARRRRIPKGLSNYLLLRGAGQLVVQRFDELRALGEHGWVRYDVLHRVHLCRSKGAQTVLFEAGALSNNVKGAVQKFIVDIVQGARNRVFNWFRIKGLVQKKL